MNYFLPDLLSQQFIDSIAFTLLHSLWQAPLIALIMGIVLKSNNHKTSHYRYNLSLSALLLVLASSIFTFSFYYFQGVHINGTTSIGNIMPIQNLQPAISPLSVVESSVLDLLKSNFYSIVWTWLIGVSLFSIRLAGGGYYLSKIKKSLNFDIPESLRIISDNIAKRFAVAYPVRLALSDKVDIPILLGHLSPIIVIPLAAINRLSTEEVETILAHEMAHIARKDFIQNIIIIAIESLFFYHPAVWWISSLIRSERENCCDDLTVRFYPDRIQYAKTLVKLQEMRHQHVPHLAMTLFNDKKSLMKRIKRILNQNPGTPNQIREKITATVLLVVAVITFSSAHNFISIKEWNPIPKLNSLDFKSVKSNTPREIIIDLSKEGNWNTALPKDLKTLFDRGATLKNKALIPSINPGNRLLSSSREPLDLTAIFEVVSDIGIPDLQVTSRDTIDDDEYLEQQKLVKEKAREIRQLSREIRDEVRELRNKYNEEMQLNREQLKAERDKLKASYKELSKEQRKKLKELKKEMKESTKYKKYKYKFKDDEDWDAFEEQWLDFSTEIAEMVETAIDQEWIDEITELSTDLSEDIMAEFDEDWVGEFSDLGRNFNFNFNYNLSDNLAELGANIGSAVGDIMSEIDFSELEDLALDLKELESELSVFNAEFKTYLENELKKDGLLVAGQHNTFELNNDVLEINGKIQSSEMTEKYQSIIAEFLNGAFKNSTRINFEMEGGDLDSTDDTTLKVDIRN